MGAEGGALLSQAKAGDREALARLLTWLEREGPSKAFQLSELVNPSGYSFRFGVTGPPGAGKSTLTAQLVRELRAQDFSVAVLAVDPSSPFTQGAVLGDRIRYSEHFLDPKVFIRSLGTRGSLGGLSASSYLMLRAFDLCGFDFVLVETVGVGQTELDILHVADQVGVVLVPESGDSIQAMKAGLMEIADVFVVNKSDRPGAEAMAREIENSIQDGESGKSPKVIRATASTGQGVGELLQWLLGRKKSLNLSSSRSSPGRLQEEARSLLRAEMDRKIAGQVSGVTASSQLAALFEAGKS